MSAADSSCVDVDDVFLLLINFCFIFFRQTKVNVTKMESIQRHSTAMEGEDSFEQCYLAMLAHAV